MIYVNIPIINSSTFKPFVGRLLILRLLMSTPIDLCCTSIYSPLRLPATT